MTSPEERATLAKLGGRARAALAWQFLAKSITTGLQMLASIILARLLMPEDFGILAMATMVTGLAAVFQDLGLGQALVQRKDLKPAHITSAFWGTLLMGTSLCGLMMLAAPYVGTFFKEPQMTPVLQVISFAFLITPFGVVPRSLLQRELDFKRPFYAGVIGGVAYAAVGITMAVSGYSYWSLVAALLASSVAATFVICALTGYLPPLIPSLRGVKDLYGFGVGLTATGILNYVAQKADYLVIARILDSAALGLYTKAFEFVHFPFRIISSISFPVLFPTFAQLQDDLQRVREAFALVLTAISLLAFPALALLAVTAAELVPLLLGEQWQGAVLPIRVLAFAGMLRTVINPGAALARAFGRVYSQAWRNGVYAIVLTAATLAGTRWHVVGVSFGALMATIVVFALNAQLVYACCRFGLGAYVKALRSPVICTVIVLLAALETRDLLIGAGQDALPVLVVTTIVGMTVGAIFVALDPFRECKTLIRRLLPTADAADREELPH